MMIMLEKNKKKKKNPIAKGKFLQLGLRKLRSFVWRYFLNARPEIARIFVVDVLKRRSNVQKIVIVGPTVQETERLSLSPPSVTFPAKLPTSNLYSALNLTRCRFLALILCNSVFSKLRY